MEVGGSVRRCARPRERQDATRTPSHRHILLAIPSLLREKSAWKVHVGRLEELASPSCDPCGGLCDTDSVFVRERYKARTSIEYSKEVGKYVHG